MELLDVYPTLVQLCKLPKPRQKLEGKSLVPLLQDPEAKWNRPAYSQIQRGTDQTPAAPIVMGRSVRNDRWRYTEWADGREGAELYDHEKDPQEFKNLAKDESHAETVAELKKLLEQNRR